MPNGHIPQPSTEPDEIAIPPTEAEVQTIINSIKEASSGATSPPPAFAPVDEFDEGAYWDLSSMAPLNAASTVSIHQLRVCTHIFPIYVLILPSSDRELPS